MNPKVDDKLRAVTRSVKDLDKASHTMGRIGIRNARRSLWARIRALQAECDAQYTLPLKPKPESHNSLEGMAKRMTAIGFNQNFPELPIQWPIDPAGDTLRVAEIKLADREVLDAWFQKLAEIVIVSCAHFEVPPLMMDATQISALNLSGSGTLGLRGITPPTFFRQLAKWILFKRGELKQATKRKRITRGKKAGRLRKPRPGETTQDGTIEVNLLMIELLKINGYQSTIEKQDAVTTAGEESAA